MNSEKRLPNYAGSWYESDAGKLNKQLNEFMEKVQLPNDLNDVSAVIAPHAGLRFSGHVSAYAYKALQTKSFNRIFLLGPSHHIAVRGAALPTTSLFATPLGDIRLDCQAIKKLETYDLFSYSDQVHKIEHSLELHLPFIAKLFKNCRLIPIVIGSFKNPIEIQEIAQIIANQLTKNDVVIVSSDFIHYGPRFEYMPFGELAKNKIKELDMAAFELIARHDMKGLLEFRERTQATICGIYPTAILCELLPSSTKARLLKYATSADVCFDDNENMVSYMSIAFNN